MKRITITFLMMLYIAPIIFGVSYASPAIPIESTPNKDFTLSSEPWLSGWTYRKVVNVDHLGGIGNPAGANYQIFVNVTYSANMQTDFDDIRFTDNDKTTLLDHWLEIKTDSSFASYWVEVKDSIDGDMLFYMYYGNSTVSSASDGETTFLFFDDFENNNMNRWSGAGGYWTTGTARVKRGTYSCFGDAGPTAIDRFLTHNMTPIIHDESVLVHLWVQSEVETSKEQFARCYDTDAGTVDALVGDTNDLYYDNGLYALWESNTYIDDTWFRFELALDFSSSLFRFWKDRVAVGTADLEDNAGAPVTYIDDWNIIVDTSAGEDLWLDDVYIRRWVTGEPEFDSFGSEEEYVIVTWSAVDATTIIFYVDVDTWALEMLLIFGGLFVMIGSTTYATYQIRERNFSTDNVLYILLMFFIGAGLFFGGIAIL